MARYVFRTACGLLALGVAALGTVLPAAAESINLEFTPPPPESLPVPQLTLDVELPPGAPSAQELAAALSAGGDLDAAAMLARQTLDAARAAFGEKDDRTAVALTNLATVHERQGAYDAAIGEYQQAIERLEGAAGPRDPRLIAAWYGLGLSYFNAANYTEATAAFQNALQLHRMNNGLFRLEQLGYYDALARSEQALGREREADVYQARRLTTAERVLGGRNPDLAPALQTAARWYHNAGRHDIENDLHAQSVWLLEKAYGRHDPRLFEPLIAAARSAIEAAHMPVVGPDRARVTGIDPRSALSDASDLLEDASGVAPAEQARRLIELGDMYFHTDSRLSALRLYKRAHALLVETGSEAATVFGRPALLSWNPVFDQPAPAPGARAGWVEVEFTVTEYGRATGIGVVGSEPAGHPVTSDAAGDLVRALRAAPFRPAILNGEPQRTEHVRYRYMFNAPDQ